MTTMTSSSGYTASHHPFGPEQDRFVISALFADPRSAEAAIRELREVGIPPDSISVISRNEDHQANLSGAAGVSRENIGDVALTYRASTELPNDEDLPSTEADLTGRDPLPVVTDFEVPPNEPLGGSHRLGLSRDSGLIRRPEADTNADEDIYTDFPDEPGGINPDSPAAPRAGSNVQEGMANRTDAGGSAAVGAGIGGVAGLLVGMAALAVPGVGPFLAAGPLAGALGGLLAGSAAGGIIGALSTIGVPEQHARTYAARIEQGHTFVSVRTDEISCDLVERVLLAHGGTEVREA